MAVTTKAAAKKAQDAAFLAFVRDTLAECDKIAVETYRQHVTAAPRAKDGYLADACGGAFLKIHKPSHRLRTALKALGQVQSHSSTHGWVIASPQGYATEQGMTGQEIACRAACDVLKARFPEDGEFYVHSYID